DAYTVLGVARGLSDREYKVAYLKLAKTCHPDMNPGDKDATARFQAVSASYEKVKDAAARARYE
ncbi:DnaJ domain-containing protein, partial [Baffinella frigidus]